MKKTWLVAPLLVVSMIAPLSASAAGLAIASVAIQQVSSDVAYGGCYALLSKAVGTGCTGSIVSFDCDGLYNKNGAGNRHYSTALLAFSLNKPVTLYVDTANKYSGYCVVSRISVLK